MGVIVNSESESESGRRLLLVKVLFLSDFYIKTSLFTCSFSLFRVKLNNDFRDNVAKDI